MRQTDLLNIRFHTALTMMPDYKNKRGFDFIVFLAVASIKAVQHKEIQLPFRVTEFFLSLREVARGLNLNNRLFRGDFAIFRSPGPPFFRLFQKLFIRLTNNRIDGIIYSNS